MVRITFYFSAWSHIVLVKMTHITQLVRYDELKSAQRGDCNLL